MITDFWQHCVLKSARKALYLPYARLRSSLDGREAQRIGSTAYGVKMVQLWGDRTFVYCHGGIYGRFLADHLEQRRSAFTFVDLGANQGVYSLIAARNPACSHVIAFEPVAATHALLQRNILANGLGDRVTAHRLGVGDVAGRDRIHIPAGHSGMASLSKRQGSHAAAGRSETIEIIDARRLGDLLVGDGPLLLKVDVEGLEATVIQQVLACSEAARVETVFFEVDRRWSDGSQIAAMLATAGLSEQRKVGFGRHFDVLARRPS